MNDTTGSLEGMTAMPQSPSLPRDDRDLASRFESLGDNCEFGILQRYVGVETPTLLRFNVTHLNRLLEGLENRFADLALPGRLEFDWHNEWIVRETRYEFWYHTFNADKDFDQARLLKEQTERLIHLAAKFMRGLASGDRIYVRKGQPDSVAGAVSLNRRLREHGPTTLLWVTPADADNPSGSVEWIEDGLMRGWLPGFAPYDKATDIEPMGWMTLLRRAWALRYLGDSNALPPTSRHNVLAKDFGGWNGTSAATAEFDWTIPRLPGSGQVMKHVSLRETGPADSIFGCLVKDGLVPGSLYVASVHVWIEAASTVTSAGLVLLGQATVQGRSADLTRRDTWQLIWTSACLSDDNVLAYPLLMFSGPAGTTIYTAGWRLEAGPMPQVDESAGRTGLAGSAARQS